MPDWTKSTDKTETIDILLFDGFSNLCLANTVEPLRAANMISAKALYKWRIFTLSGAPAVSSSGLNVTPDAALDQNNGALLAVMPSYGFREMAGWRT